MLKKICPSGVNRMIVTIEKVEDESIVFSNGWRLASYHDRDCCEHHYLDMRGAKDDLLGQRIDLSKEFFERVENYGIRLLVEGNHPVPVAGYGLNNGYYSSDMQLLVKNESGVVVQSFDVSECQDYLEEWL